MNRIKTGATRVKEQLYRRLIHNVRMGVDRCYEVIQSNMIPAEARLAAIARSRSGLSGCGWGFTST